MGTDRVGWVGGGEWVREFFCNYQKSSRWRRPTIFFVSSNSGSTEGWRERAGEMEGFERDWNLCFEMFIFRDRTSQNWLIIIYGTALRGVFLVSVFNISAAYRVVQKINLPRAKVSDNFDRVNFEIVLHKIGPLFSRNYSKTGNRFLLLPLLHPPTIFNLDELI